MARIFRSWNVVTVWMAAVGLSGCSLWPFAAKDHTAYATPAKRVAAVEQLGAEAASSDPARQQQLTNELALKIQSEPDPIVREAILRASSQFETPMADRILLAALGDADPYVRRTACKLVGGRGNPAAVAELGRVARNDSDVDVRLAATRSLGELGDSAAIAQLSPGLHDSDPAMQLATVESLKLASGQDLGSDVGAWRQWVASQSGTPAAGAALADRSSNVPAGL
jgi:HEAT repeat protein